jgi:hypothetical protein
MALLIATVALPLKILAAVVVFGPVIFFAYLLVRAARKDGDEQAERDRGGSSES